MVNNMKIKMVLFDLDGTLLPMDMDTFIKAYFSGIAKKLHPYGYEPEKLIKAIWDGTYKMIKNDGTRTNEEAFWEYFATVFGNDARKDEPKFESYYIENFDNVKNVCGFNPKASEVIKLIKDLGLRVALATNPIFPSIATEKRISWAGLSYNDFELFTTYENCRYCKPNLNYYLDILDKLEVKAEECLMVGNDVDDDMITTKLGMKVFLLTDCLINNNNKDISFYPNGNFDDLIKYIRSIS